MAEETLVRKDGSYSNDKYSSDEAAAPAPTYYEKVKGYVEKKAEDVKEGSKAAAVEVKKTGKQRLVKFAKDATKEVTTKVKEDVSYLKNQGVSSAKNVGLTEEESIQKYGQVQYPTLFGGSGGFMAPRYSRITQYGASTPLNMEHRKEQAANIDIVKANYEKANTEAKNQKFEGLRVKIENGTADFDLLTLTKGKYTLDQIKAMSKQQKMDIVDKFEEKTKNVIEKPKYSLIPQQPRAKLPSKSLVRNQDKHFGSLSVKPIAFSTNVTPFGRIRSNPVSKLGTLHVKPLTSKNKATIPTYNMNLLGLPKKQKSVKTLNLIPMMNSKRQPTVFKPVSISGMGMKPMRSMKTMKPMKMNSMDAFKINPFGKKKGKRNIMEVLL